MIDEIVKLKDFVPLFQSLLWVILIALAVWGFYGQLTTILTVLSEKIRSSNNLEIWSLKINSDLSKLKTVESDSRSTSNPEATATEKEKYRIGIYQKNEGIFLSHLIYPTKHKDQKYDIFIYLIRHRSNEFKDIEKAEFFFGHKWRNEVFDGKNQGGLIGVHTSAYAPFLCTCTVKLKDGKELILDRYIDFEIEKILK